MTVNFAQLEGAINWIANDVCQFNFGCIRIAGNVCGDFGISLTHGKSEATVCYERQVVQAQLMTSDDIQLTVWHSSQATFNLTCYAWCSDTENLPNIDYQHATELLSPADLSKLTEFERKYQLDSNFNSLLISKLTWDGQVATVATPLAMSPIKLYMLSKLSDSTLSQHNCIDQRCSVTKVFHWMNGEPSTFMFVTMAMTGNTCGDYGMVISHNDESINVCFEQQVVSFVLNTFDRIEITLWWAQGADFQLTSFAWSTLSGRVPSLDAEMLSMSVSDVLTSAEMMNSFIEPDSDASSTTEHEAQGLNHIINWSSRSASSGMFYLSPAILYQLSKQRTMNSQVTDKDCNNNRCSVNKNFKWLGAEKCHFHFACTEMIGNACGDFGVVVGTSTICQQNQVVRKELERLDEVEILLWFSQEAIFSVTCFAWCTSSGSLPGSMFSQAAFLSESTSEQLSKETSSRSKDLVIHGQTTVSDYVSAFNNWKGDVMVSPTLVYDFDLFSSSGTEHMDCTDSHICYISKKLVWNGRGSCSFMFACTEMTGNACGDYGLVVAHGKQKTEVCFENQYVSYSLNRHDQVTDNWMAG